MTNTIQSIALDKLVPHPANPNRMSKANFAKLVRNIERTGRYEPLVVRPCPQRACHSCETCTKQSRKSRNPDAGAQTEHACFEIINGHHRAKALAQLGYETADAIVWDVDDEQVDILLATLNRLGGSDILDKKLALLKQLNKRMQTKELTKLLPQTAKQIERLVDLKDSLRRASSIQHRVSSFANPLVFFLNDEQSAIVEDALFLAQLDSQQTTRAAKRAASLTEIARFFLATSRSTAK